MYMIFRRRLSVLACCLTLLNFMFIVHAVNFEIKHCLNYHATLKNHNRSTALERSVIDFWGVLNMFYWIQILALSFCSCSILIILRTTTPPPAAQRLINFRLPPTTHFPLLNQGLMTFDSRAPLPQLSI